MDKDMIIRFGRIEKAAEQGDPEAQVALAEYYERGIVVKRDVHKYYLLLQKAAQGGSKMAEAMLGWGTW